MKGRIFLAVLLVVVALFAGRHVRRAGNAGAGSNRAETRQTQRLEEGARVEVRGINGPVEIRTAETDTAEVRVYRTGDLEYGKVTVELSPSAITVRGERDARRGFWRWLEGGAQTRQQVTLTVPRRVQVVAGGVNGNVEVGEVDGPVAVESVNGRVLVANSAGRLEVRHVNGGVRVGVSRLDDGMDVSHVNGSVDVRLRELVNADIETTHHNGRLTLDVPNVTMQQRREYRESRARLGAGGALVHIKHVNGNVRFDGAGVSMPPPAAQATAVQLPPLPPPPPPVR